jgi:uncharacterized protein (DUF3820 family)
MYKSLGLDDVMPFGKYKGKKIRDLNFKYIYWLVENKKFNVEQSVLNVLYLTKSHYNTKYKGV